MNSTGIEYTREVEGTHAEAVDRLKESLKENRWGVMADIDVKAVLKEKVGADVESYNVLDVCNPGLANEALGIDRRIGLVMPCKMAVYADGGRTKVSLYLPTRQVPTDLRDQPRLLEIANEAENSLKAVLDSV